MSEKGQIKILRGPRCTKVGGYLLIFIIKNETLKSKEVR